MQLEHGQTGWEEMVSGVRHHRSKMCIRTK